LSGITRRPANARWRPHRFARRDNRRSVTTEGRREIVGLGVGPSKAEPFWSTFLKGHAGDRARREDGMIRRAAAMLERFANHPT